MNIEELFPGKYLKAADLAEGELQMIIASVQREQMQQTNDEKAVIRFHDEDRGFILNKTNMNTIATAYGKFTEAWIGQPLVLFATSTDFQGRQVACVRVRVPSAQPPAAPLQAVAPTAPVQPVAPAVAPVQPVATPAPQPVVQPVAPEAAPQDEVPF